MSYRLDNGDTAGANRRWLSGSANLLLNVVGVGRTPPYSAMCSPALKMCLLHCSLANQPSVAC
jgi:hypothetical protein